MDLQLVSYVMLLMFFLPAAMAWAAQTILRTRHPVGALLIILVPAALPGLWLFFRVQEADAITLAAKPFGALFMFVFACVAAGLGFAQARQAERK